MKSHQEMRPTVGRIKSPRLSENDRCGLTLQKFVSIYV